MTTWNSWKLSCFFFIQTLYTQLKHDKPINFWCLNTNQDNFHGFEVVGEHQLPRHVDLEVLLNVSLEKFLHCQTNSSSRIYIFSSTFNLIYSRFLYWTIFAKNDLIDNIICYMHTTQFTHIHIYIYILYMHKCKVSYRAITNGNKFMFIRYKQLWSW